MKRFALHVGIVTALVTSCSIQEESFEESMHGRVFYASFEQPIDDNTKVYVNEDLLLRWNADDRVSIFNKNTYNQQYKFTGDTGSNTGSFSEVESDQSFSSVAISHVVSVYPFSDVTNISKSELLSITLPAEQFYSENTFGLGANTMVSVSKDNNLQFKNVGGYLKISLFGEGVSVSSIILRGNNGEKLAGNAAITMPINGEPNVELDYDATTDIILKCENPITLASTVEKSTDFWFVLPPVTLSKGFTIIVKGQDGLLFCKSTLKTIHIARNKLSKMSPIQVERDGCLPNNIIQYTSSDGRIVTPSSYSFNASIVSNCYMSGIGIITFSDSVNSIGQYAFRDCSTLTSISLPESVSCIEYGAYYNCSNLTSIIIPDNVTSIGNYAFRNCSCLASITLPHQFTSIGYGAFMGCINLSSITNPFSVLSIGEYAFSGCSNLSNITLLDGLKDIGYGAFYECSNLRSITIPMGVTSIGDFAFIDCNSLTNITVLPQTPPSGGRLMFGNTNECPIYVPGESLDNYRSTQYWQDYSYRLYAITEIPVKGISLNKTNLELPSGKTETLVATVFPENATNKSVTWTSSNTSVATVSSSGVVEAKTAGSTIITVKTNDGGKTATCNVTVTTPVSNVSLFFTTFSMAVGDTFTISPTITPSNATNTTVTWSSNNPSVASVSPSGLVTAKGIGTATVTVKTNDGGKTASCVVSVIDIESYPPGDKAYVGTGYEYPSSSVILSQSSVYSFNVNTSIVTSQWTGHYIWVVIPYGYSLYRANNLSFQGDWIWGNQFLKERIVLNGNGYNKIWGYSSIALSNIYELFFTEEQ